MVPRRSRRLQGIATTADQPTTTTSSNSRLARELRNLTASYNTAIPAMTIVQEEPPSSPPPAHVAPSPRQQHPSRLAAIESPLTNITNNISNPSPTEDDDVVIVGSKTLVERLNEMQLSAEVIDLTDSPEVPTKSTGNHLSTENILRNSSTTSSNSKNKSHVVSSRTVVY